MIDVTIENFETEVIQASASTPILVDFWAPWCGPCKNLSPVLEKLETEYAGRFTLVKIDSDQEQQLAAAFGIRSIPTCVLLVDGKPVDGFQGALPEGKVREFLDKHIPMPFEEAPALQDIPTDPVAPAAPPSTEQVLAALQTALAADPGNDATRFDYLKALVVAKRDDDAQVALAPVIAQTGSNRQFDAIQRWLSARAFTAQIAIEKGAAYANNMALLGCFDEKIAANKRDFEARFSRTQILIAQTRWTDAMDELLEILMRDKTWSEDKARKTYLAILEIIDPPKAKVADGQIPAQDPVVASYRRRLSSVVLS